MMQVLSLKLIVAVLVVFMCSANGLRLGVDNVKANGATEKPGTQHWNKVAQVHLENKYKEEEAIRKGQTDYAKVMQREYVKPTTPVCKVERWTFSLGEPRWKCAVQCNAGCSPAVPIGNARYAVYESYVDQKGHQQKRIKKKPACKRFCCPGTSTLSHLDGVSPFNYNGEGSEQCVAA